MWRRWSLRPCPPPTPALGRVAILAVFVSVRFVICRSMIRWIPRKKPSDDVCSHTNRNVLNERVGPTTKYLEGCDARRTGGIRFQRNAEKPIFLAPEIRRLARCRTGILENNEAIFGKMRLGVDILTECWGSSDELLRSKKEGRQSLSEQPVEREQPKRGTSFESESSQSFP